MKRITFSILAAGIIALGSIKASGYFQDDSPAPSILATDVYSLKLRLDVPQVVDNTTSQGKRSYRTQNIVGTMSVNWLSDDSMSLTFSDLINRQFSVGGKSVTYKGYEATDILSTHFTWIGNNKTDKFTTPTMSFFLELEPSYAITEVSEDNSFYLTLAGKGGSKYKRNFDSLIATRIKGNAAGTQGCGCMDYSHKSPTRIAGEKGPTGRISDVVATFGTWQALWKSRIVLVR